MADVFFKLGRKSTIYLFLLVIFATFTVIKDDKQFRFESTDVAELHVGKLVSARAARLSSIVLLSSFASPEMFWQ